MRTFTLPPQPKPQLNDPHITKTSDLEPSQDEFREIVNVIFYQNRTGCQWAYLQHDLPPKSATYYYFALCREDGSDQAIHDLLRCQARERAGRAEDPTVIGCTLTS